MSVRDDGLQVRIERELIRLSPPAAEAFTAALSRPAEVNHALLTALKRPKNFRWLD